MACNSGEPFSRGSHDFLGIDGRIARPSDEPIAAMVQ
jgi:hypothetical protein